jgi:hypothetical protein
VAAPLPPLPVTPADLNHLLSRLRDTETALVRARRTAETRGLLLKRCLGACRAMAGLLRLHGVGGEQLQLADLVVYAIDGHLKDHGLA